MSVTGARVSAIFVLFGVTMLAGLGPVFVFNLWKRKQESDSSDLEDRSRKGKTAKILHILLVFGGGVLLATCFVHMIPEISENYESYMEAHKHSRDEPTTFASIELMDGISISRHPVHDKDEEEEDDDDDDRGAPWVQICICIGIFLTYFLEESVILLIGHDAHHHSSEHRLNDLATRNESAHVHANRIGYDNPVVDLRGDVLTPTAHHDIDREKLLNVRNEGVRTRFLRGLVIVVAFLAHAIFDGVAIGLQTTTTSVWTIFFAICLHKLVVVFAIGFELFEKTASLTLTAIHIAIFSAMSPLGIVLSIIIENGLSEDGSLTLILLNAVATGAILYIVFLEILQANRCPELNGLIKLASLVAGFILMTLMTTLVSDGD